jgi:CheY-like chemotaxis protein
MLTHCAAEPEDTTTRRKAFGDNVARRSQTASQDLVDDQKETSSVASTLLAVDDSVTMRKVLEITFAGPDFRVVTANSPDAALQKLKSDKPDLVIADLSLEPNGYDLCKAIKKASPATPVLVLSSKQNAFDAAKGSAAQADDHMDKPFDTQQMIDKVKKLLSVQAGKPAPSPVAAAPAAAAPAAASPVAARPAPAATPAAAAAPAAQLAPPPAAAANAATSIAAAPPQRAKTLIYNPPTASVPAPVQARPAPAVVAVPKVVPADAAAPAAVASGVNGQMAARLEQIGLSPAQVDAVLALSREVVERVVWEVVPVLAETIIKEEIARLTK